MNERIELIINDLSYQDQKIVLFGVGGVGGTALEALVRSGFKTIDIYDFDVIDESNLNRQVITNSQNIGLTKVDEAASFAKKINSNLIIKAFNKKITKENIDDIDLSNVGFIIDAIDDVEAKVAIIKKAKELNIKIISSMGTGNKLNPQLLEIVDINQTSYCPLAKIMRRLLKDEGINHVPVIYSKEQREAKGHKVGTMMFVPSTAGLLIVSYIVRVLIGEL